MKPEKAECEILNKRLIGDSVKKFKLSANGATRLKFVQRSRVTAQSSGSYAVAYILYVLLPTI